MCAVKQGSVDIVKMLLRSGADVNGTARHEIRKTSAKRGVSIGSVLCQNEHRKNETINIFKDKFI